MLVRNLSLEFVRRGHAAHITYISDAVSLGASETFERRFQEELTAGGVTFNKIGHSGRKNLLKGAIGLRRTIRQFRPDVFHSHLAYGLLFQAAGLARLPTAYTHHNIRSTFPPVLFRVFDRFVSRYVAICRPTAELLHRHTARPIELIHNGVPSSFAEAPPRRRLGRDVHVLSVGNLRWEKDHASLVEAAARLIPMFEAQGRRISFSIAGSGPERETLQDAIAARGLSGHVELLGTRTDIAALMASADMLAQPSRSEGLPITLIEAAMSGLPIVASDVGGCSDVVHDGRNGALVPPQSPDRLAEAIAHILADEGRYVALSAEARAVAAGFSLDHCAAAHLRLYTSISAAGAR